MFKKSLFIILLVLFSFAGAGAQSTQTLTYASTLSFSTTYAVGIVTLTGNVSSFTISNGTTGGQQFTLEFCQDSVGGRVIQSTPTNYIGTVTISPTPAYCTYINTVWFNSHWVVNKVTYVLPIASSGSGASAFNQLTGTATSGQLPAATPSAQGAVILPAGAGSNTLGTASITAASAYDAAGTAAAAITTAEAYSANAANLTSGTIPNGRLNGSYTGVTGIGTLTAGSVPYSLLSGTVPTWNQNTTGTAANLSGTPALPNGTTATTQTVGDNTNKLATDSFVLANGGTPNWAAPGTIGSTTPNTGVFTILTATTSLAVGSTPPNAIIAGVSGGYASSAGSTALTPTANTAAFRFDSSNLYKMSLNAGSEFTSLMSYSVSTLPALNQNTTGSSASLSAASALPNGTTATTQTVGTNNTSVATTAFVIANSSGGGSTNPLIVPRDINYQMMKIQLYSNGNLLEGSIDDGNGAGTGSFAITNVDANGVVYQTYSTGTTINTQQGWVTSAKTAIAGKTPTMKASFGLGSAAGVNAWVLMCNYCSTGLSSGADPSNGGAIESGFRYFAGTDTTWTCYAGDGAHAGQTASSGVAVDTTNLQTFDFFITATGVYNYYINGTQVCSFTPTHPMASTTKLGIAVNWQNTTTTSVATSLGRIYLGSN
jgi:hypothetical protein